MQPWTSRARVAALVAVPLVATAAALVATARGADPPALRISIADLDLDTEGGVAVLHGRIRAAARQVCASGAATGSRLDREYPRCVRQAVDRAVSALDVAALARLHAELTSDPALCATDPARPRTII